jgi:hypothetical protein
MNAKIGIILILSWPFHVVPVQAQQNVQQEGNPEARPPERPFMELKQGKREARPPERPSMELKQGKREARPPERPSKTEKGTEQAPPE